MFYKINCYHEQKCSSSLIVFFSHEQEIRQSSDRAVNAAIISCQPRKNYGEKANIIIFKIKCILIVNILECSAYNSEIMELVCKG